MDLGFLKNLIPFLGDKNKKPVTTPPFNPDIPASDPPPSTIVPAPIPVRTGTSAADGITPGEYAPIVPQMAQQQASPSQAPLTPVQETQARLQSIYDKRYNKGVWKNPDTGDTTSNPNKPGYTEMVTAPGTDRDPKWSTKDKIGSALLGAAKGFAMGGLPGAIAGGVMAGTDRNFMEKQHDQMQRARLIPQLQQQEEQQAFDTRQRQAEVGMQNVQIDNGRMQAELERKQNADAARVEYWRALLADKKQGRELSQLQYDDLRRYRDFLIDNGQAKTDIERRRVAAQIKQIDEKLKDADIAQAERERHNRVTEGQAAERIGQAGQRLSTSAANKITQARKSMGDNAAYTKARTTFINTYMRKEGKMPTEAEIGIYLKAIGFEPTATPSIGGNIR